jgi:hypothetical protein
MLLLGGSLFRRGTNSADRPGQLAEHGIDDEEIACDARTGDMRERWGGVWAQYSWR